MKTSQGKTKLKKKQQQQKMNNNIKEKKKSHGLKNKHQTNETE